MRLRVHDFDLFCHLIQDEDGRRCHAAGSCHGGDEAHTSLPTRNVHDDKKVPVAVVQTERFPFLFYYVAAVHRIKYYLVRLHSQPQNDKAET